MADRLAWTDGKLHLGETMITTQNGVSIFDGTDKVRRSREIDGAVVFHQGSR